ncbi:hypothetical protein Dvar_68600 [Desulfosarcina variabilis str. Montpellier]|uniref:hypothetical protein n=1 Tax=Desulfosarcina variabilis TaxID=2300 RepID=UPI003AFAFCC6
MTDKFYSVDRRGFYQTGLSLDLMKADPLKRPLLHLDGCYTEDDLKAHLQTLFPEGLSLHGWHYSVEMHNAVAHAHEEIETLYVNHAITVELLFEYVRRAYFPQERSRFQSFFAWESLEKAIEFRQDDQPIYLIESDHILRADQRWLSIGVQNIAGSLTAHNYWRGIPTDQPCWEAVLSCPVKVKERVV